MKNENDIKKKDWTKNGHKEDEEERKSNKSETLPSERKIKTRNMKTSG